MYRIKFFVLNWGVASNESARFVVVLGKGEVVVGVHCDEIGACN